MEWIAKICLVLCLLLIFSNCFRKKSPPTSLSEWLEAHFSGRFEVVDTYTEDAIRNWSFQVKKSVVAERTQPLVQAVFRWDKRDPDLGLSQEEVEQAFVQAARELADARSLHQALLDTQPGRVAVGIYRGTVQVLFFEEPVPAYRKRILEHVKTALSRWSGTPHYAVQISLVEPSAWGVHFQDIVPVAYWVQPGMLQQKPIIFLIKWPQPAESGAAPAAKDWQFNGYSDRLDGYMEQARGQVKDWAANHLQPPYTLLEPVEYAQEEEHPARLQFKFPYAQGAEAVAAPSGENISGYLLTQYDIDQQNFSSVRCEKE